MKDPIATRFRGFLPVVVDVETGGVDPAKDALLELAGITIRMDEDGLLHPDQEYHYHITPFEGGNMDPVSMSFNKIDPYHPFRFAIDEAKALNDFFDHIQKDCQKKHCPRAVLVGHNAWFDHHFIKAAAARTKNQKNPFHRFTSLDTATLSGLAYGQTVLSKALAAAKIPYNSDDAHSAIHDARWTAQLFCKIINQWQELGGWPPKGGVPIGPIDEEEKK